MLTKGSAMRLLSVFLLAFAVPLSLLAQEGKEKRVSFAGIPMVDYNRSLGLKLGGSGMAFFPVSRADTISPPSQAGAFGMYTGNSSWGAGAFTRLFWSEGRYRFTGGGGVASVGFQYFDDQFLPGGGFISFNTGARFVTAEITRLVVSHLYAGVAGAFADVVTEFEIGDVPGDAERKNLNTVAIPLQWDTRDNVYNPAAGQYAVSRLTFSQPWLGSDYTYTTLSFTANGYRRLSPTGVLAGRLNMVLGLGDVPFEAQRVVGRDDIRGYSDGKYRGEQVYTAQAEYRRALVGRFGAVAFAGLALALNPGEEDSASPLLPGVGGGIRYLALPALGINVGFDAAVGRGDWGIYFRIGEAF